jgi:hypothetical protein
VTRPTFVFDKAGDLTVFRDDPSEYLEAIDVELGEYEAFDVDGQRLSLTVNEGGTVVLLPTGTFDLDQLEHRAHRYAATTGVRIGGSDFLLDLANHERIRDWELRWPKRPRWLARRLHGSSPPPPFTRA